MKIIFTWWNKQTFGTFLKTLFTGKYVGKDKLGNKYYKNKNDERWVIYSKNIEATKITSDWYLWMHHTIDKIPDENDIKKFNWQKKSTLKIKLEQKIVISQQELKKMLLKKNMKHGSNKIFFFINFFINELFCFCRR